MELEEAIRTAATCRRFRKDPVPNSVLARALSLARFAPSGGNRQPVRFVVVRDPGARRQLRDRYLPRWEAYVARLQSAADATPRAPTRAAARLYAEADHFARHLHEVPVLVVVCFETVSVLPTDRGLGRVSVVGGASIYPAVQNFLLACRGEGLGAALTTLLGPEEPRVRELLGIPDAFGVAATLAVGWPERPFPKTLRRRSLGEVAFLDRFGAPFPAD